MGTIRGRIVSRCMSMYIISCANLMNLNGFQAKMRQKRIENASKSPCFFYSGGVKFEFWIAEKCIFFFYLMLICLRIVYRFWTCTGSSLRTNTASIIIVEGTWNPFPENKNIGLLRWKHPYFWSKTSVLLPKEVRCFTASGPLSLSLLQKKFSKISYISYTNTSNLLYLLTISGEG